MLGHMLIGLISDTHLSGSRETPGEELREAFCNVDLIMHAGDVMVGTALDWLESIAPVVAARGNNDWVGSDPRMQPIHLLTLEGWEVAMVHDLEPEERPIDELRRAHLGGAAVDVLIAGHTHFERLEFRDGVLLINPGSATLPHYYSRRLGTIGLLELAPNRLRVRIRQLGSSPGLPNPGKELDFERVIESDQFT